MEQVYRVENTLDGQLWIYDRHDGAPIMKFDPKTGDFHLGGQGLRGRLLIQTADDLATVVIDGADGVMEFQNAGKTTIKLDSKTGDISYTGNLQKLD